DGGMPAFSISSAEAAAIAAYVMRLRQPTGKTAGVGAMAGDSAAGERYFRSKNCASCHMLGGGGGVLGPDLTGIGHESARVEQALRDPAGARAYKAVTIRFRSGEELRGIAKNESRYDLQLLATDGKLHLLQKDQLSEIVREKSLMPTFNATPDE